MLNMFSAYLSKKFRLGMLGDALLYGFVYAVILLGRIKNIDLGGVLPVQSVQYYFPFFVMGLLMRKYQFLNGMVLNKYSYACWHVTVNYWLVFLVYRKFCYLVCCSFRCCGCCMDGLQGDKF